MTADKIKHPVIPLYLVIISIILSSNILALDPWYDPDWKYRKSIIITERSGNDLNEYQIFIVIDTEQLISEGKLRNDCADIRFTESSGNIIDFYRNTSCGIATTGFWVKVPDITANSNTTIYFYYGNQNMTDDLSNIDNTFSYSQRKPIYYIVDDDLSSRDINIAAYRDSTSIEVGSTISTINSQETITISSTQLSPDTAIYTDKQVISAGNFPSNLGGDNPAPISFAGKFFVYNIYRCTQSFDFYSPFGNAQVTIKEGNTVKTTFTIQKATAYESDTDITDGKTVIIISDIPILAHHHCSSGGYDYFVMYPATTDLWGVPSRYLNIGVLEDNTEITIYRSDGTYNTYTKNSGDNIVISGFSSQGSGLAVHIVASKPVGAHGLADSDGIESEIFLPEHELDNIYIIPQDAQYIAIATTQPSTTCYLYNPDGNLMSQQTSGDRPRPYPNKIYFGSTSGGTHIQAGSRLECTAPVYAYYEYSVSNGETNLWGRLSNRQYMYPEPEYTIGSEELAYICGENGCEIERGEDYINCPEDCCKSDGTACSAPGYYNNCSSDNICHQECSGYNNADVSPQCDSRDISGGSVCADIEGYCDLTCRYITCPGCSDCSQGECSLDDDSECDGNATSCACINGVCSVCDSGYYCDTTPACVECSNVCDGFCSSPACHGTDPDCDSLGSATLSCCGNNKCEGDAGETCENCIADCGVCPLYCGDGICNATIGENSCTCAQDCGICGGDVAGEICKEYTCVAGNCSIVTKDFCCGNGVCEGDENYTTCSEDCPSQCGDGICNADKGENRCNCPIDCGYCSGPAPGECMEFKCDENGECIIAKSIYCCGNGICDPTENYGNCPDDCESICGDNFCDESVGENKCNCPVDCGICDAVFPNICKQRTCNTRGACVIINLTNCCGNSVCEFGENSINCPSDCKLVCGDGRCEFRAGENCRTCPEDCGECPPFCGDNKCSEGENKCNCAKDCGLCEGSCGVCREFQCHRDECLCLPVMFCCGNNRCESDENYGNCPSDCHPESLILKIYSPEENAIYMRGDKISLQANVSLDGYIIPKNATVSAILPNSILKLYDDGKHNDINYRDGIYGNIYEISSYTMPVSEYILKIEASVITSTNTSKAVSYNFASRGISITDKLIVILSTDKGEYNLTDTLNITVLVKDIHQKPRESELELNISSETKQLVWKKIHYNATRPYTLSYKTTLMETPGLWKIIAYAKDKYNNSAISEKLITMKEPITQDFLTIKINNPHAGEYLKGSEISLDISVFHKDSPVNDAEAVAVLPGESPIKLKNFGGGRYTALYFLKHSINKEHLNIRFIARKGEGTSIVAGYNNITITLVSPPINIEILEPKKSSFTLGEKIKFRVKLTYPDNTPVELAEIKLNINNKELLLRAESKGIYTADYIVGKKEGNIPIKIYVNDIYGNSGFKSIEITSHGISARYYLRKYDKIIPLIIASILISLLGIVYRFKTTYKITRLIKREKELENLKKELQDRYFNQGTISKEEFEILSEKYEKELGEIALELEKLRK